MTLQPNRSKYGDNDHGQHWYSAVLELPLIKLLITVCLVLFAAAMLSIISLARGMQQATSIHLQSLLHGAPGSEISHHAIPSPVAAMPQKPATIAASGIDAAAAVHRNRIAQEFSKVTQDCRVQSGDIQFTINGQACPPNVILKECLKRALPDSRLHTVQVNGSCSGFPGGPLNPKVVFLRPKSSDVYVFSDIWLRHEFGFLHELFKSEGFVPRRIMDLGMNCGMASLYFATYFPDAQIVSVEPNLHTFAVASLNLVHYPNVHRELGAASEHGGGYDALYDRMKGAWGMGVQSSDISDLKVDGAFGAMDVSFLMHKYGWESIDYLKVDIEGSEKPICEAMLAGKADWINKVRCVTFEYHDRFVEGTSTTCDAALTASGMRWIGLRDELTVWCR